MENEAITKALDEDRIWRELAAEARQNTLLQNNDVIQHIPKKKRVVIKLSKTLKKNYGCWLDWDYYGKKITYDGWDEKENKLLSKTHPVACNDKRSLNFWREKSNLSGNDKRENVIYLMKSFWRDEITPKECLHFVNPISQTKISLHNRGQETYYYVNRFDASVSNLMIDWDDKERLHFDTEAAARWLDESFFFGHGFIQSSTSGTGTHQYIFIKTEGVSVKDQKKVYRALIPLLRLEAKEAGFKCWSDLDAIKGVAPEVTWKKSTLKTFEQRPWYLHMKKGGLFAKFPRLASPADEAAFINRKILPWEHLTNLVAQLEDKWNKCKKVEAGIKSIDGLVPEPVDLEDFELPVEAQKVVASERLNEMFMDDNKMRVSLATVFMFEFQYGRRPTEEDFSLLNDIYIHSATATGLPLTDERRKRFTQAISYSEDRKPISKKSLISTESILRAEKHMEGIDLSSVCHRLSRLKQRALTINDLGRIWCYFDLTYNDNLVDSIAPVPFDCIKLLSEADVSFDPKRFPSISRDAFTAAMNIFEDRGWIEVVTKAIPRQTCATYRRLVDLINAPVNSETFVAVARNSTRVDGNASSPVRESRQTILVTSYVWPSDALEALYGSKVKEKKEAEVKSIGGLVPEAPDEKQNPICEAENEVYNLEPADQLDAIIRFLKK